MSKEEEAKGRREYKVMRTMNEDEEGKWEEEGMLEKGWKEEGREE